MRLLSNKVSRRHIGHPLGFTLVELVVVIAVMAIIGGMSVGFVRLPVQGYILSEANGALVEEADTVLRRMGRDIRNALPNSVRITSSGSSVFIEYVPILSAGRYRSDNSSTGTGDVLEFGVTDTSFDVLGPAISVSAGQFLVVYNMGKRESDLSDVALDVYQGNNRRAITSNGAVSNISFTSATPLIYPSPSSRFYVASNPVTYECNAATNQMRRYGGYAITAAQPTAFTAGTGRLISTHVANCNFQYSEGLLQRSGVVSIDLTLTNTVTNSTARLVHLVNIVNAS